MRCGPGNLCCAASSSLACDPAIGNAYRGESRFARSGGGVLTRESDAHKPAGSMSGGQQQMLALSLAILGTPRCLMLDEPSIGLAPNLVKRMFQQVRDVSKSHAMTEILVEQNVAAA
jgi:ABC-type branched-subunit amino acid transport system ATPase component